MENYLAVVRVKGAKTPLKASFSCEGTAAAIKKMCELLQTPISEVEEYDLMEMIGNRELRIVASRGGKVAPKVPVVSAKVSNEETTYQSFTVETI